MEQIQEPGFEELVKNLYATKKRELTQEKFDYIKSNYKGKEEEFVKNFYATIGEELPQEKFDYIRESYLKKKSNTTSPSPSSNIPSESVFGEIEKAQKAFDADKTKQSVNKSLFGQKPIVGINLTDSGTRTITDLGTRTVSPKAAFNPIALEEALTNTAVTDKASRNQIVLGQGVNENIPVRVSDQLKNEAKNLQVISDRMVAEVTPILTKAITPFVGKGIFTDNNGNVSDAKIDRFALTLSNKWGNGQPLPYVKELVRGLVKNTEESAIFQQKASKKVPGQLQKLLGSKLPTAKLAGKDVPELSAAPKSEAEYIKGELDKAAAEQANLLIQTANSQNKTILQEYKKQETAINQEYEPLFKSATSQEQFNALAERYYTSINGIKDKANRRLQRQQSELNKSIQSKLATLDLPENVKKNLQAAWLAAGKEVQEEELKSKKLMQDAFVEQWGFSGLFGKSLASSLLTGLASRGDGLTGIGMGGQVADWLRTFREPGLELETVDLELKGQNWFNPQTYITRLGKQIGYQAPGMIASYLSGNPFLGGIIGWGDENLQNAGETYAQVLSETNNPLKAERAAKKYLYTSAYTIPLYFAESEMFLRLAGVKSGGNFFQNTLVNIPIENIQEGIQGYTGQLDYKDAKTLGAYLKKDFPNVALETTITTVLQNALFAGLGKVGQSLGKKKITPEEFSRNYVYNLVANKGINTAFAATELKFANGLISKEQLAEWKSKITEVANTVETLKGLGLSDEQIRGYVAIQAKRDELRRKFEALTTVTPEMLEAYKDELDKIHEELKQAALGKVPSTTVTFPSGGSVTIAGDEAKDAAEELKGEAGTNIDLTTTEEAIAKEVEEIKKAVPQQTNDELFDKMTDLQQMFYENGVEARVDDNGVVTVQDLNGQEVDIDILPDDVINGINEYKGIFAQLQKKEDDKKPPRGTAGMLMVRSINDLKAEIELMKQGKDTLEKRLKIAEFEKEIAEQERLGIPPNKGRTVSADLEYEEAPKGDVGVMGPPKGAEQGKKPEEGPLYSKAEENALRAIAQKIVSGEQVTDAESLQLQANYPAKLEQLIKEEAAKKALIKPQDASLMDSLDQVVTSLERLRGQPGVTQEMVVSQMAPITDQMAAIEKEFAKQGFIIDVDYDTVVIRKDSKEGQDYTQPEDLPKPLQKLAAEYEMAALELLGLDETSFGIALQKSKGVTEDVPYEEVSTAKDSDEEGKPLGSFAVGDIVYTNYSAGKKNTYWNYTEYKIVGSESKGKATIRYTLKDVNRNVIVEFPVTQPGFILKEKKAEETKAKPKNPKTNTEEFDKALEDFTGEKPKAEVKEKPKPIKQLGTGDNVYFENDYYRVNDATSNRVILNVYEKGTDKYATVPLNSFYFSTVEEAMYVAEELNRIYPKGVPAAALLDKIVNDLQKNYLYAQQGKAEIAIIDNAIKNVKEKGRPLSEFKVGDKVIFASDYEKNWKQYTEGVIIKAGEEYQIKRFSENPISKKHPTANFTKNTLVIPKLEGEPIYTGEEQIPKAETPKEQPSQKADMGFVRSDGIGENELRAIVEKNVDYFKAVKSGAIGVVSVDFGIEDGITYMDTFDKNGKKGTRYYVDSDKQLTIKKPATTPALESETALESAPVVKVPVAEIKTNVEEYQGRKNKFSERSAANVAKNFDINKFDPIVVYKHPDGNIYVLSGHSRLEGVKRRGEFRIPARFFTGTPEEAKEFALKSNKLGTLQTDLENAAYYREAMQKGKSFSSLMAEAKETEQEGTATRIMDYAMLNPKGKAYQALESLEAGESDSSTNVKIIAQKVGRIRAKNDHLTDAHENELFDYFLENGYPTDKEVNDPANVLNRSINAVKFDPKEPLNLSRIVTKSPERTEWERELKELESQLAETKKQVTPDKKTGWTGLKESIIAQLAQGKTQKDIDNAEKRFNENANGVNDIYKKKLEEAKKKLSVLQDKLAKHKLREKSLIQGEKSQTSLFDTIEEQPQEAMQFSSAGEQLEGELIEIPGYEKLDFVITQDGMSFRIYDLVTGQPINEETYFSKEEAVTKAQEFLKKNFQGKDSESVILNALYKKYSNSGYAGRPSPQNKSPKFQKYVKEREQREQKEFESFPFLNTEEERQMLLAKAEEAKAEGLDNIALMLTSNANRRNTPKQLSAKIDEQRATEMISEGKKKKLTEEEFKNQQPLTFKTIRSDSEEAFKEAINETYKTDRFSQIPADYIKRGYQAFKKEIAIRNKYGYLPKSFNFNYSSIVFNRYLIAQKSNDAARIKQAEAEVEDYIKSVNELYDIEFPATPKEAKQSKRKIRDEKLKGDIDNALDDLFGSSSITLTSFGIDPERLEKGVKVLSLYAKAGLYKFKDIVEDLYEKYGEKLKNILEEIKAVYAYYRIRATKEERELMDVDVADYTYDQIIMDINEPDPKQDFITSVEEKLISKERQNIITLRKLAQGLGLEAQDQELQEYVELAIINVARRIAMNTEFMIEEQRFEEIKDLYQNQPTISMRSSERIEKQQYSTPIPISFTAGMFAQTGGQKTFLDPSAGNGMLLINVDGSIQANEIDRTRAENLEKQGFIVTNINAEEVLPFKVDSVLTNPPFGTRDKKTLGEFNITGLAPQMAINALNTMKDDGTAVIIVGGHAEYDERGVLKGGDRAFLNYLYQNYNVIDVINVDGSLYAKQGTSFPIRMILIGGRKSSLLGAPVGMQSYAPLREDARAEAVKSFDELYNRVKTAQNELLLLQKVRKSELGEKPISGVGNVGGTTSTGDTGKNTGLPNQPVQPSTGPAGGTGILGQPGGLVIRDSEQLGDTGNAEGLKEQSVDKVNIEKVQGGTAESVQLPRGADERIKEIEEAKKVRYEPGSKSEEIGSVVPANMAEGIKGVLSQFPDVDDFVRERLGYKSKEELFSYLSAEQIDGVAIAISQIENNKGVIIGDMTGVGKGRQAAAIIRYAVKQGLKPVFMTEKAGLFSDIYRDLINIGSGNLKPFIVNDESEKSDPKVYVDDGTGTGNLKVLHRPSQRKDKLPYYTSGTLPKNVDFVLITYSQLSQEKIAKEKRAFFASIAAGNVLILDESHNASGEGNTGKFLQSVLPTTKGVTFLSATYSKNPDTMAVYGIKTSISEANMSQAELISAVKNGGAVLQEILSKQLTEIGEYVRRERDSEGVETTWETAGETPEEKKAITDIFDGVASILRSVLLFQRVYVNPAVRQMDEDLKGQQGSAGITQGTADVGVSNTPFASKVFNITRQLMFSLKAEKVAEAAIDEIKKGNKVVIAVSNTMEGFLEDLDFEEGLLASFDYTLALQKALTGVMRYTVKSGGNQTTQFSLNLSQLSPEGQEEFRRITKEIKAITTGITISPIDVIKSKIEKAGFTIAEITGRSNQVLFNEEGRGELKKRKTDKKEAETGFTGGDLQKGEKPSNNAKYNAVVLNMSGSTGISLHASKTFRDQRPRVMIMAQMQLDVNTEIQVRGRIDRTGQVSRGRYRYILSPIPAENRLAMMFIKKLKSLSANTSGSQQTKEDAEIVDFLNKYGDEKVLEYLKEATEINAALFDPLRLNGLTEEELERKMVVDNAAHITSGRVALLSVKQQQDFYEEIAGRYTAYIASLDANNENDLKAQVLNLKAKTLSTKVIIQGKNNKNPFSEDSVLEEVEMDNNKFPLFRKEIDKQIQDRKDQGGSTDEMLDAINEFTEKKVEEEVAYAEKVMDEKLTELESLTEARKANAATEQDKEEINAEYEGAEKDMRERYEYLKESRKNRVKQRQSRAVSFVKKFVPGQMYLVPLSLRFTTRGQSLDGSSPGVFIGFTFRSKSNLTPSNISARFAVLDSRRVVDVPLSQSEFLENVNKGLGMTKLENWDEERKVVKSRRKGYIITGNILQAANYPGKIIKYTTEDGQIKDGILMPESLDAAKVFGDEVLVSAEDAVEYFLQTGAVLISNPGINTGNLILIQIESRNASKRVNSGDKSGIKIYVSKSKSAGGKFFLNEGLRNFVENRNFVQRGSDMIGTIPVSVNTEPPYKEAPIVEASKKLFAYLGKEFGLRFSINKQFGNWRESGSSLTFEEWKKKQENNSPKLLASQKAKKSISEVQFNELVNKLKAAFPQAKIITKEEALQKPGGTVIKTAKGVIYGLAFPDGSIYLNSEAMSAEAAIHEFSHLWEAAFPQEWKNGIELMRKSSGFQKALAEVKSNREYAGLTPGEQESEALNTIIGKKGEGYFRNEALSNFKAWLRKLFVKIADQLGLGNLVNPDTRFEQFTDKVIGELLNKKAKTFTTSRGKPKLSSQQSAIDEFDNIMQSKNVVERQNMQYEFIKKYGVDKFKKLRDITLNFGNYVDQLEKDNYIKDKLC